MRMRISMKMKMPLIVPEGILSVALETNGKGFMGYIVELPGAFVRGRTEEEALSKVGGEVGAYMRWLGVDAEAGCGCRVVQRHRSALTVEDADNEVLLEADRGAVEDEEFRGLRDLALYSGETFLRLYTSARFKDWVDEARIRRTFWGENPRTIREIFEHVRLTQYYYLSRTKAAFTEREEEFLKIRRLCLKRIGELWRESNNSLVFDVDNELWTLKKVLRRFVWHDRIHGKAITRILEKQKRLGIIDTYEDAFCFMGDGKRIKQ
ncbi:MAG: hypothetical protein FJZ49_06915 [Candidatus Verstraetearchaeota archaeon]|nr:hypothetical protein [Candidatus Verstraetearchaeota archaeon]